MRLPTLLVPLPTSADNHQWHNARAFEETGAAQLLEQIDATPEKVSTLLRELVEDTVERDEMRSALASWHEPKAAEKIAEQIFKVVAHKETPVVVQRTASSERLSSEAGRPMETSTIA